MLGALTEKMHTLFSKLAGKSKLTEDNIAEAVSEVRLALLEADVNYGVVKTLLKRVKEQALGDAVIKSVSPGQQFIKVVHDELVALMGGKEAEINLATGGKSPAVILLCGLQGSGKTTASVKLARYFQKKGLAKKPWIAACDLQRPAAIDQLKTFAGSVSVPVFSKEGETDPLKVAQDAIEAVKKEGGDLLIVDTAGRLHIDDKLMTELEELKKSLNPQEVLFVANAALGQDAVNTAAEFNKRLEVSGSILTMLDGNARGGAAISIREVTGKPLKFECVGEKPDDIQPFNPVSMAHRIMGMGDTINLVRKAQEHFSEEEAKKLEHKLQTATFTYSDYLSQIGMVKKMGSLKSLLSMLPGASRMKDLDFSDKEFAKIESMIQSMTTEEKEGKCEIIPSRRHRIAKGSGNEKQEVDRLIKTFNEAKNFFKNMPDMNKMKKMMGGSLLWR